MNGNNPYAGAPGVIDAGRPAATEVSPEQRRALRRAMVSIATQTRDFLPDGYTVGSELSNGSNGLEVTVAVRPPVGRPVSAGLTPSIEDIDAGLSEEDQREVARGLAASAAFQVMSAVGDSVTPTAR
jgi:hypothetical protein